MFILLRVITSQVLKSLSLSVCVTRSVYSGHQSILIPPVELESNPALWLLAVSQMRVRDTFCSYSVMELCTKGLGLQTEALKVSRTQTQATNQLKMFVTFLEARDFPDAVVSC